MAATVLIGAAQIVAGAVVKSLMLLTGEFIGNMLTNTGMDDITFGITCAACGEFSWRTFWSAKQASLLAALKTSLMVSGASYVATAAAHSFRGATEVLKMSHAERLETMARVSGEASVNLSTHVSREVARTFLNADIS